MAFYDSKQMPTMRLLRIVAFYQTDKRYYDL
nr:MAG TPA: hypothetical protein [Caudoviricetes sp.]